jgi:hypothetical protein
LRLAAKIALQAKRRIGAFMKFTDGAGGSAAVFTLPKVLAYGEYSFTRNSY